MDIQKLKQILKGEVSVLEEDLKKYSRDASIFEIRPEVVVHPVDSADIQQLVKFVGKEKLKYKLFSVRIF